MDTVPVLIANAIQNLTTDPETKNAGRQAGKPADPAADIRTKKQGAWKKLWKTKKG
jgi:hypothetical protein